MNFLGKNKDLFNQRGYWLDIIFLLIAGCLLFMIGLTSRAIGTPDGARYTEIAREMLALKDYVTPHLDFIKYFEKPPLFYWLEALSLKLFGLDRFGMRAMNAFVGVLGLLLTYISARKLFDRKVALVSAMVLCSSLLYFVMGHLVTLDMTLAICISATLFCFIAGAKSGSDARMQTLFFYGMYIFSALAVMTKGLVGILLPGFVIFLWLLIFRQWRLLKSVRIFSGSLLFLLIAAPWHILVQMRHPEFFHFYFVIQQFSRYFTMSAGRYQPDWTYIPIVILGFFPWTSFMLASWYQAFKHTFKRPLHTHTQTLGFMFLWATSIFIFFSLSHSKLIPYILPIFPPLAILTANYLVNLIGKQKQQKLCWLFVVNGILALLIIAGALIAYHFFKLADPVRGPQTFHFLALILTACLLIASVPVIKKHWYRAIVATFALQMVFLAFIASNVQYIHDHSIEPLALKIAPLLTPNAEVVSYNDYYQDLPVYLKRRITVVNWRNELTFGLAHQALAKQWMINEAIFVKRWQSNRPVFAVSAKGNWLDLVKRHHLHYKLLGQVRNQIAVSNQFYQLQAKQ